MSAYILYFILYSLSGWLWELVYGKIRSGKWSFSGYLTLPLLPIYGFSALGIMLLVQPYIHNPAAVFVAAAATVSLIEYTTSYVLEKVFHLRLWDYRDRPMNINGRISVPTSLGFGFMGLVLVYVVHPLAVDAVDSLPSTLVVVLAYSILGLAVIDYIDSTVSLARLRVVEGRLIGGSLDDLQQYIEERISDLKDKRQQLRLAFNKWYRHNVRRLRQAYPGAKTVNTSRKKKESDS